MSVVGLTFGIAAKATRPAIASAASRATIATTCAAGRERSYQAKPASRTAPRMRKLAVSQDISRSLSSAAFRLQGRRTLLGEDYAGKVKHPGHLGREVPAAGENLARRAVGNYNAVAEQDNPVGKGGRELYVVGGDDDAGASSDEAVDQIDEFLPASPIHPSG